MNKQDQQDDNRAPGKQASRPAQPDREERHQLTRELAPTDQERQSKGMAPGGSASAAGPAEGNPADREERIRRKAYELWEQGGRQEGQAEDHWHRAAQDLDREDAELRRPGTASRKASERS